MGTFSYQLIVCAERFYQEIDLRPDGKDISIGTDKGCDIRFGEGRLSDRMNASITHYKDTWRLNCSEQMGIIDDNDDITDTYTFHSGDHIEIVNKRDHQKLFTLLFFISFEIINKNYDRMIRIDEKNEFMISKDGEIQIDRTIINDDVIKIEKTGECLQIDTRLTEYGIHVNGILQSGERIIVQNGDFFAIRSVQFFFNDNCLYTMSDERIKSEFVSEEIIYQNNHFKYPKFNRSVRQRFVLPNVEPEILDPKPLPEKPEANILASFLPAILSVVLILAVRSSMGGSSFFMVYSAAMMGIGVVTSVITYRTASRKYKADMVKRESDYRDYLSRKEEEIVKLRNQEYEIACYESPSVEEDIRHIADFDAALFCKKPGDDDFLSIRIGDGIVKTKRPVKYRIHEYFSTDDYLEDYPESISRKYEMIQKMPVCIELAHTNNIGFVGVRNKLYQMVKNIVISLSAEHFWQNARFYFVLDKSDTEYFMWTRWCQSALTGNGAMRNYIYDEESEKYILESLYEELLHRDESKTNNVWNTYIVIFVYRSHRIAKHPIIDMVKDSHKINCTFIFFEEYEELLNENCEQRIFLDKNDNKGYIQNAGDGTQIQEFYYPHIPHDVAAKAMLKIGCAKVDEADLEEKLPGSISFFNLINILSVNDIDLEKRWSGSNIRESMKAPIGVRSGGDIVSLDIHEKSCGPHGLVAGTTGSGKSELLQTYLLSLATLFHPYEVNFVIIDFKGGGMANQFQELPHMNCAITNIDGREIDRSLLSIRAELLRRQKLFAENGVNHIDDYIDMYKQRKVEVPLPHLILVVDEFAELKSEQPEFMKELISTARIGRSLGVHLILATQKPSGVVNDQIWSNSRFKLCLKVQNTTDSNEILKSPLAAEIREPGRAYLQVGNNEIFQLFQSAYSGASVPDGSMGESRDYRISQVDLCGRRTPVFERRPMEEGNISQLEAMVKHISEYCNTKGIKKLDSICMPQLPKQLPYTSAVTNVKEKKLDIGWYDAPEKQHQDHIRIALTENIYIVGTSRMGKTNLLETIIRQMVELYTPEELRIAIFDYGSQILKSFENMCHVDKVIIPGEESAAEIMLKEIEKSLQDRKGKLAEMGLSSHEAYVEAGGIDMPEQVLIIDNVAAFREMNTRQEDRLLHIIREGNVVGICIIVTSRQIGSLGYRYLSNFSRKIALFCNDSGEYASAFGRCHIKIDQAPGRCIVEIDRELYEGQIYNAFPADKEINRNIERNAFIDEINRKYPVKSLDQGNARKEQVTMSELKKAIAGEERSLILPIGKNEESGEVDTINLKTFDVLAVCGGYRAMEYFDNTMRIAVNGNSLKDYCITVIGDGTYKSDTADEYIDSLDMAEEKLLEICTDMEESDIYQCLILQHPDIYEFIEGKPELRSCIKNAVRRFGGKKFVLIMIDPPNEYVNDSRYGLVKLLDCSNNAENEMFFKSENYCAKYLVLKEINE